MNPTANIFKSITILGCGAVGLYYGSKLAKNGFNVKFLLRSDYEHIKKNGIKIDSVNGNFELKNVNAYNDPKDCANSDLIIVSLKTTAKKYLLEILPKITNKNSYVLTLQNGLGNEELISTVVSKDKIIGAVAFVCLNRVSNGHVNHSAFGLIKAQEFHSSFNHSILLEIQKMFIHSGLEFEIIESMLELKWEKLVWNIPFNGLSALLGGTDTLSILKHAPTFELTKNLMKEVVSGANFLNIKLNESLIQYNIDKTFKMGPYLTSMALDRIKNNPIEVESIIGEPYREAKANGLNLPYMESLYAALSFYNSKIIY